MRRSVPSHLQSHTLLSRHCNFNRGIRVENPSKSPFTKGDFQFPPLEKGGRGDFWTNGTCEINSIH
jgi:hypothetical protein